MGMEIALQLGEEKAVWLSPENWGEVTQQQWKRIAAFLQEDSPANRIEVAKAFVPKSYLKYFFLLPPEIIYDLTEVIGWMWEEKSWQCKPFDSFTTESGTVYLLPEWELKRSPIIELAYADAYFEQVRAGNKDMIDNLILSICRPKRPIDPLPQDDNGDLRERFNPVMIELRKKDIANLDEGLKAAILRFFFNCRTAIANRYPVLFKKRIKDDDDDDDEPSAAAQNTAGWLNIIQSLAPSIVEEEKVQFTNIHNCLVWLTRLKLEEEERNANTRRV